MLQVANVAPSALTLLQVLQVTNVAPSALTLLRVFQVTSVAPSALTLAVLSSEQEARRMPAGAHLMQFTSSCDWIGLDWIGLDCIALDWIGFG